MNKLDKLFPWPYQPPQQADPPPVELPDVPDGIEFVELLSSAKEIGRAIKEAGLRRELQDLMEEIRKCSKRARSYAGATAMLSGNKAFGFLAIQREDEEAARIYVSVFSFEEEARETVIHWVSDFLLARADRLIRQSAEDVDDDDETQGLELAG
jgi:hypothetical protein